jgi:hypothetical protein
MANDISSFRNFMEVYSGIPHEKILAHVYEIVSYSLVKLSKLDPDTS